MTHSTRDGAHRTCARCGSDRVVGPLRSNAQIYTGIFGPYMRLRYYVCGACGHMEAVVDEKDLARIIESTRSEENRSPQGRRCRRCGTELKAEATFCSICGEPV